MSNIPFDINSASDLVDLSIQKIWIKSGSDLTEYHKKFYNVEAVKDYMVKDSSLTSISTFSKIPENGNIPADSPYQGFDKTYTQAYFSGMLRITRAMWRYGISARKLQDLTNELRKDAIRFKENVLAGPIINMASTSYTDSNGKFSFTVTNSGGDASAPKATDHTREDGGSDWANEITDGTTSDMDFDYDALKAARKVAQAILGGVGEKLDVSIDTLLCKKESSVHHRAQEILKNIEKGEMPNTANRDSAISFPYKIVANPYLTSDTGYAMFDSSMVGSKYGLQLKQGMPLTLDPQFIDYDNKEMKYSAGMDFAYGFNDFRGWVLSTGLNT